MLWLYILLGILLLLFLLMLIPIGIDVFYTDDLKVVLKLGFVPLTLLPQKSEKKPEKKAKSDKDEKKDKDKKKSEEKKPSKVKEKGISWLTDVIKRTAKLAEGALKDFFKHILIKKLMLSIKIVGKDAADTAVKYGGCCAAIYPSLGVIMRAVRSQSYGVDITPDFEENAKTEIFLELKARIFLFWIVTLVFKHGFKALRLLLELKN